MSLVKQRAALAKKAGEYKARLENGEDLTDEQLKTATDLLDQIKSIDDQIADDKVKSDLLGNLYKVSGTSNMASEQEPAAKSIGDHFVNQLKNSGYSGLAKNLEFEAPEYDGAKATTDIAKVGGGEDGYGPYVTDIDKQGVFPAQRRLVIADLIPEGTLGGSVLKYPVFPAVEGNAATVAEAALKPQVSFGQPSWITEGLAEIAAWTGISDTMAEDLPYLVTQINQQLMLLLQLEEENQLLLGDGTASNLTGIMNRDGVQAVSATETDFVDQLARAKARIRIATMQWAADAIVLNPNDYTELTLKRDQNGQYYGGGFFQNAYGNGQLQADQPLWGLRTVTTPLLPEGTALVGSFQSALLFRKGGIKVESTKSHSDWFAKDQIAIRARERVGLEVKWPAAFAKVTVGAGA